MPNRTLPDAPHEQDQTPEGPPEPGQTPEGTARVRGRSGALIGLALGYFMTLLDTTVLSVAEPDLARSFAGSMAALQWAVAGYTVAFGALLLTAGAVADRVGAHRLFRLGIIVFGVGSLLSALAPHVIVLVALRVLIGAAAAACLPASLAMIAKLYPEPGPRAKALAAWAAISGTALAAGPVIGGVLVDLAGWRAIFLINVPVAVLVLALTAIPAEECVRGRRPIDVPAQLTACVVLALLTDTVIAAGSAATTHALLAGAGTVIAAGVLLGLERRSHAPALAPDLLRSRGVAGGLIAGASVNFLLSGGLFVLPLVFQQELSPSMIGLALLPLTLPCAVNPILTGRIVSRVGPRMPVLLGLGLLFTGSAAVAVAVVTAAPYAVLAIALAVAGFGVSFALPALVTAVVTAAPEGSAGASGGLLNSARQVGATLGVAVLGSLLL